MFTSSTHKRYWLFESASAVYSQRQKSHEKFMRNIAFDDKCRCLTLDEEQDLRQLIEETALKFCESFDPPLPPSVAYVGYTYFKRVCMYHSSMDLSAKNVMMTSLYLACKVEEFNVSIDDFVSNLKSGTKESNAELVLGMEAQLMVLLRYHLTVHVPYRPLEGHLIEIKTKWHENSKPEALRKKAEEFLWKSLLTDVSFLFPPSQIALAALLYSSRELHHNLSRYISIQLCSNDVDQSERLLCRLNSCIDMVRAVRHVSSERSRYLRNKLETFFATFETRRKDGDEDYAYASKKAKPDDSDTDADE